MVYRKDPWDRDGRPPDGTSEVWEIVGTTVDGEVEAQDCVGISTTNRCYLVSSEPKTDLTRTNKKGLK